MNILYFGAIDWFFLRQRPQQLALALSRRHRVIYVFPRSLVGSWMRRRTLPAGALAAWHDDAAGPGHRLHLYEPRFYGQLRGSVLRQVNRLLLRRGLESGLARRGFAPDWIWLGHPSQLAYASFFPGTPVVYDCMDEWSQFADPGVVRLEDALLSRSRVVLASSQTLHERMSRLHPKACLVPNGVEHAHFRHSLELRRWRSPRDRPRAVTMGTLGKWIDLELVQRAAELAPGWDFDLIGPWGEDIPQSARPRGDNVRWVGPQPYERLPALLAAAEVAFLPFRVDLLTRSVDPVKAYEFLAAGLPIVSTRLREMEKFPAGIFFVDGATAMPGTLEQARQASASETFRAALSDSVRQHDWAMRGDTVAAVLESAAVE